MKLRSVFHVRETHSAARMELLDFMRGIGMLLVLIHHSGVPPACSRWILAFHMAFLFLLSGYTMYLRPHFSRFSDFIYGRFLRLVVPYFLFEGLNLLVWSVSLFLQGGWQDLTEAAVAILTCVNTEGYTGYYGRLWFWPCMFVSDIFFYFILHFAPRSQQSRQFYLAAMIPVMLILSWITCRILPYRLPFAADTACMATAFILTGYLFGRRITWLVQEKHLFTDIIILLCALLAMRAAVLTESTDFLMFINQYGHYGYTLCAAFSGSIATLIISKWLYQLSASTDFFKSFVLWYGYHSLGTFPVHLSIKMWIYLSFPLSYRRWYILLPAMLLLNTPVVNLITEYFPFMLGKITFLPCKQKSPSP